MFENLGLIYKADTYYSNGKITENKINISTWTGRQAITFDLTTKAMYTRDYYRLDVKTLKAINQQCKELGWLDE